MNAVFFDMDGTLIDSRADLATAVNVTRAELNLPPQPLENVTAAIGNGARNLLEKTIPECANRFAEIWPMYFRNYLAHMLDATTLYPNVVRTLSELQNRGWLLGVNTNKPAEATHGILEHFGLLRYFGNAVIAGGDCAEMKPSAMPLRDCAARLRGHRLSAYDWMVGDNWTDTQCAQNAGIRACFCTYGYGALRDTRCNLRINRFEELLRTLKAEE